MRPDGRPGRGWRASSFLPLLSRASVWAGLALCTAISLVVTAGPRAAAGAPPIVMDGEFDDWVDRTHLEDAPDAGAEYDVHFFHWGTNPDESFMYFMVERYPPGAWAPGVKCGLYLDMQDNGRFEEDGDFRLDVYYLPSFSLPWLRGEVPGLSARLEEIPLEVRDHLKRLPGEVRGRLEQLLEEYSPASRRGLVLVLLYRYSGDGARCVWFDAGNWGESETTGGLRCEWPLPFEQVGHVPGQMIRIYLLARPLVGTGRDRVPDVGDLQWAPIPALGWPGMALLFVAGSGLVWLGMRRRHRHASGQLQAKRRSGTGTVRSGTGGGQW